MNPLNELHLACALITNKQNQMLVVRKENSSYYMMAGGKVKPNESTTQALIREIKEELNLTIAEQELHFLGQHTSIAVNEKNTLVYAHIYHIVLQDQKILVSNEIKEAKWLDQQDYLNYKLANLISEFSVPRWIQMYKKKSQ